MRRFSLPVHHGEMTATVGCPRGRTDCSPLSRAASDNYASFFCCGETDAAPVPTDRLRLCVKSTHDNSPVDVMVHFDERDATDAAFVVLGGLSALVTEKVSRDQEPIA